MKKRNLLYAGLILAITVTLSSCFHDHDISISVNDDDDVYRMRASYDEDQARAVQRIINSHLCGSISFHHGYVDTDARLNDGTSVYIKARPGRLKINFDRSENTEENFEKLEQMCEEIKDVLAREDKDNY